MGFAAVSQKELFFEKGIAILERYAFEIDYVKVLELLPSSMDVMHLQKYIEKVLPYLVHKRRTMQIKKNLHKRLYLRQQAYLAATKSRVVRMDATSFCSKCNKRIGSSFFILDPVSFKKFHHSCFYKKRVPKNLNVINVVDEEEEDLMEEVDTPMNVPSYHDHLNNPFVVESNANPFGSLGRIEDNSNDVIMNAELLEEETNPFGKVEPQKSANSTNPFQSSMNDTNPFS